MRTRAAKTARERRQGAMQDKQKYYIVERSKLPEVFVKVVEAKRLLQSGKAKTVNDAVERVGLSRSAFYKYRDSVNPFYELATDRIITFTISLDDEPGVLSGILNQFARCGANVLTINQNIPLNGQAIVTISARMGESRTRLETLIRKIRTLEGVIKFDILASEQEGNQTNG